MLDILPTIAGNDFPSFLKLVADMPRTWEEWLAIAGCEAKRRCLNGLEVVEVSVTPGEFEQWLKKRDKVLGDLQSLWLCARDKHGSATPAFSVNKFDHLAYDPYSRD